MSELRLLPVTFKLLSVTDREQELITFRYKKSSKLVILFLLYSYNLPKLNVCWIFRQMSKYELTIKTENKYCIFLKNFKEVHFYTGQKNKSNLLHFLLLKYIQTKHFCCTAEVMVTFLYLTLCFFTYKVKKCVSVSAVA